MIGRQPLGNICQLSAVSSRANWELSDVDEVDVAVMGTVEEERQAGSGE